MSFSYPFSGKVLRQIYSDIFMKNWQFLCLTVWFNTSIHTVQGKWLSMIFRSLNPELQRKIFCIETVVLLCYQIQQSIQKVIWLAEAVLKWRNFHQSWKIYNKQSLACATLFLERFCVVANLQLFFHLLKELLRQTEVCKIPRSLKITDWHVIWCVRCLSIHNCQRQLICILRISTLVSTST